MGLTLPVIIVMILALFDLLLLLLLLPDFFDNSASHGYPRRQDTTACLDILADAAECSLG